MLRDLGHALIDAISDSPEVGDSLRRIREQGYSLNLTLDCKESSDAEKGSQRVALVTPQPVPSEPVFRINTTDLSFLRSIGIDPTRKGKRKNKKQS